MIVVLPFCSKDAHLALANLKWAIKLDGKVEFDVVLSIDDKTDGIAVEAEARKYFRSLKVFKYDAPTEHEWPKPQNHAFQRTAWGLYVAKIKEPWFWWETDAIPINSGWLTTLATEYARAGKPFMGPVVDGSGHMNGVAIYPPNVPERLMNGLLVTKVPWDVASKNEMQGHIHNASHLMQHNWGGENGCSFETPDDLRIISSSTVLFHRCKDGTLINVLNGGGKRVVMEPFTPEKQITAASSKTDTCVICLGRYGDIMNALPIARGIYKETKIKPAFMVAEEFASILDGVSYVEAMSIPIGYNNMTDATRLAKEGFKNVVRAQIFGTPEADPKSKTSFNVMAWQLSGYGLKFDDFENPDFQLEFDVRDKARERKLIEKHIKKEARPIMLTMLTGGISSPFSDGAKLQAEIESEFKDRFQIIDLTKIKADRIYDLLAFYEVASCLITIDSATMHLASAIKCLPSLILLPDDTYLAAKPRYDASIVRYGQAMRSVEYIKSLIKRKERCQIVHTFESHRGLTKREERAQSTWEALWVGLYWKKEKFAEKYPRSSKEIGDPRGVPYVNDILTKALKDAEPQDVIVLTNNDIILLPEIQEEILSQLAMFPATCSSRRDIKSFSDVKKQHPSPKHIHCGRDLFAFRAWWIEKFLPEIPPMLVGSNEWDNLFLNLIRREAGTLIKGQWCWDYAYAITSVEMASPNVLHEFHEPFADKPENKLGPHNLWNHVQLVEWSRKYCPEVRFLYAEETHSRWKRGEIKFEPCKPNKIVRTVNRFGAVNASRNGASETVPT